MFRNTFPKILIIMVICVCLISQTAFGQTKPAGEVDVTKCWSYPLADEAASALASDGARVYIGGADAQVQALSLDGKKMWATEFGGDIASNLLATDAGLFLVTATVSGDGKAGGNMLRILSKETGITNWTAKMPDASEHFLGLYKDSVVIVSKSGIIQSIDAKTGTVKWKREIAESFVARPAFSSDRLFVASTAKQVFTILLATGEIDSLRKLTVEVSSIGQSSNNSLILGDEMGNVISIAAARQNATWKFRSGGQVSAIVHVGERLLVTSHDNFIYFLVARNGGVAWKQRLSGRVSQIGIVNDRYAFVSSFEDHSALLVDLSNGKNAGQTVFDDDENVVTGLVAPDGLILALTNQSVYAFGLNGCQRKKEGGADK